MRIVAAGFAWIAMMTAAHAARPNDAPSSSWAQTSDNALSFPIPAGFRVATDPKDHVQQLSLKPLDQRSSPSITVSSTLLDMDWARQNFSANLCTPTQPRQVSRLANGWESVGLECFLSNGTRYAELLVRAGNGKTYLIQAWNVALAELDGFAGLAKPPLTDAAAEAPEPQYRPVPAFVWIVFAALLILALKSGERFQALFAAGLPLILAALAVFERSWLEINNFVFAFLIVGGAAAFVFGYCTTITKKLRDPVGQIVCSAVALALVIMGSFAIHWRLAGIRLTYWGDFHTATGLEAQAYGICFVWFGMAILGLAIKGNDGEALRPGSPALGAGGPAAEKRNRS